MQVVGLLLRFLLRPINCLDGHLGALTPSLPSLPGTKVFFFNVTGELLLFRVLSTSSSHSDERVPPQENYRVGFKSEPRNSSRYLLENWEVLCVVELKITVVFRGLWEDPSDISMAASISFPVIENLPLQFYSFLLKILPPIKMQISLGESTS